MLTNQKAAFQQVVFIFEIKKTGKKRLVTYSISVF